MKCIKRKCPYYFQSDIYESCLLFHKYITDENNACIIEDFNLLKRKREHEITQKIEEINRINSILKLVQENQ